MVLSHSVICCWDKVYKLGSTDPQNYTFSTCFKACGCYGFGVHTVTMLVICLSVMSKICK